MATSAQYNPAVIQEFADRLYSQAKNLVWTWGIRLAVLGFIVGTAGAAAVSRDGATMAPGAIVGLVGALMGAAYGREKGFELRLRAQEALCLLQTEINTRPTKVSEVKS